MVNTRAGRSRKDRTRSGEVDRETNLASRAAKQLRECHEVAREARCLCLTCGHVDHRGVSRPFGPQLLFSEIARYNESRARLEAALTHLRKLRNDPAAFPTEAARMVSHSLLEVLHATDRLIPPEEVSGPVADSEGAFECLAVDLAAAQMQLQLHFLHEFAEAISEPALAAAQAIELALACGTFTQSSSMSQVTTRASEDDERTKPDVDQVLRDDLPPQQPQQSELMSLSELVKHGVPQSTARGWFVRRSEGGSPQPNSKIKSLPPLFLEKETPDRKYWFNRALSLQYIEYYRSRHPTKSR